MKKTPPLWIVLAFLVVAIPLAWGLYRRVTHSKRPLMAGAAQVQPQVPGTVPLNPSYTPMPPTRPPSAVSAPVQQAEPAPVQFTPPAPQRALPPPGGTITPDS